MNASRRLYIPAAFIALAMAAGACGASPESSGTSSADSTPSSSETTPTTPSSAADTTPTSESTTTPAEDSTPPQSDGSELPTVTGAKATPTSSGTWIIEATISSPYETSEHYVDAWRVLDEEGNELAIRELAHDHASEQPFTRDLKGVTIPESVEKITIEGRDNQNGWGGETFSVTLKRPTSY